MIRLRIRQLEGYDPELTSTSQFVIGRNDGEELLYKIYPLTLIGVGNQCAKFQVFKNGTLADLAALTEILAFATKYYDEPLGVYSLHEFELH